MPTRRAKCAVLAVVLCFAAMWAQVPYAQSPAKIGGPFQLLDQNGRPVSDATYRGKPALVYFGFTSCPDVCPTDLARIARIARSVRKLGGPELTPIFITVDPERDDPARMKVYVRRFGSDFVGLTGSAEQIRSVSDLYHVYYKKVPFEKHDAYTMDHSTFLFLVDRDGNYLDHFGRAAGETEVSQDILRELAPSTRK